MKNYIGSNYNVNSVSELRNSLGHDGDVAYVINTTEDGFKYVSATYTKVDDKWMPIRTSDGSSRELDIFDRSDLTTVTIGGLSSGSSIINKTTKEVLESILFPYQKPLVNFGINPSRLIYEKGKETITSLEFNITVTKKSNDISLIKIYNDNTLLDSITVNTTNSIINKNIFINNCNIASDTILKVIAIDGKENGQETKTIKFVHPIYYGYLNGEITKELKEKSNFTFSNITCDNDKVVFKYPSSYGNLRSIIDSNGFENLPAFNLSTEIIDSITYNVYTSNNNSTLSNFSYIFKF